MKPSTRRAVEFVAMAAGGAYGGTLMGIISDYFNHDVQPSNLPIALNVAYGGTFIGVVAILVITHLNNKEDR